jgi:hypothetical protein
MNLFKGLIWCECGKRYNYRLDHGIPTYQCQKRKNYGVTACDSKLIKMSDLLHLIKNHKIEDVEKITVSKNGFITIVYKNSEVSKWNCDEIVY